MKKTLLFTFYFFAAFQLIAQKKQLQTDVFVLNACSPTQISLYRDTSKLLFKSSNKLSINANRLSAFKIKNINPLRYNFYINNSLVTQFFDDADITIGGSTKGSTGIPINEIKALNIFNDDDIKNTQRQKLDDSKAIIKKYQDSVDFYNDAIWPLEDELQRIADYNYLTDSYRETSSTDKTKVSALNKKRNDLIPGYTKWYRLFNNEIDNYRSLINNLSINGGFSDILKDIDSININPADSANLISSKKNIKKYAANTIAKCDTLDTLLLRLKSEIFNTPTDAALKITSSLKTKIINNGYAIDEGQFGDRDRSVFALSKYEQFVADTKLRTIESFVLMVSLDIGKLLQKSVIDGSSFQNLITEQTCLDTLQPYIQNKKHQYTALYNHIQDICSNLSVLIKYLELDNNTFKETIKSINTNYTILLQYLKTLDFVDKNNTREFTLPMHNNLRNVDLIRYDITREDILTKGVQSFTYDIWLKGGLKIDFSAGIFLSQLNDDVFNKNAVYSSDTAGIKVVNNDSLYLNKANNGKYGFAFGGMVNISPRLGAWWITPGFSVGVAYSNTNQLQMLSALNLQFGKSERLIMHIGMAGGVAKRLDLSQLTYNNDPSNDGTKYKVKADPNNFPIPYNDKFIFKPFFGISYNLSKKNALQAATGNGLTTYKSNLNPTSAPATSSTTTVQNP